MTLSTTTPGLTRPPLTTGPAAGTVAAAAAPALSPADFQFVASLVREHAAIEIGPDKEYLVEQRIGGLVRQEGEESISSLVATARRETAGRLTALIVDAMTTNETSFYRDPTVFEFLRAEILPELIERNAATKRLRIWCAASSSGQEPYSIAMLIREHFPEVAQNWQVRILATDISSSMVARTAAGRYSRLEVNRGLPAALLVKYFQKEGLDWEISADVRRWVDARECNLARALPFTEQFDLVMLRNVLIYFSVDTKRAVLDRIKGVLAPHGALFLGATESTMHIDDSWVRRSYGNSSCYHADNHGAGEARP
jgi:chemotaxis protein methyltransferase CheR